MMRCRCCESPRRAELDVALLLDQESECAIARKFGVKRDSLRRHKANHLRDQIAQSKELRQMLSAETLTRELNRWNDETWSLLARAKQTGNLAVQLGAIRAGAAHIETFVKVGALTDVEARLAALEAQQPPEFTATRGELSDDDGAE